MATKIPTRYRVTLKDKGAEYLRNEKGEYVHENGELVIVKMLPPLGFANAYEPDTQAYEKRKKTQDEWAYGPTWCGGNPTGPFEKDGKMWVITRTYDYKQHQPNGNWPFTDTTKQIKDELQPIIIDNIPLEGFRVQKSVSRYSTSNKLWRILDPRGFELEITTGTFEDLIMEGTIEKGLIHGACIWKTAKMLVRV